MKKIILLSLLFVAKYVFSQTIVLDDFEGPSIRIVRPNEPTDSKYLWAPYYGAVDGTTALSTTEKHDGNQSLQSPWSIGSEWQFHQNAYTEDLPGYGNGWQFTKNLIKEGTWQDNTYNRLRFWIKLPPGLDPSATGNHNFEFGSFLRCSTCPGHESGNMHYYHMYDIETTGEWEQVIVDMHPTHQRGHNGAEEYGVLAHPTGEPNFNYFDLLVGFYLDAFTYGTLPPMPANFYMDDFEFYNEPSHENEDQVYSVHGVYVPSTNNIKVGWQRRKDQGTLNHEVRYSFSDIHTIGWDAAIPAPGGTIIPPDAGPYAGMKYATNSIDVSGQSDIYIAIRPVGATLFTQIKIPLNNNATGITTYKKELIDVYPNPAQDKIYFDNISSSVLSSMNISIYSLLGEKLLSKNINMQTEKSMNVSTLPSGIYFLKFSNEKINSNYKIVIAH